MSGDVADPDLLLPLLERLESNLRRVAWEIVAVIVEAERARRAELLARTLSQAFDTVAVRKSAVTERAVEAPESREPDDAADMTHGNGAARAPVPPSTASNGNGPAPTAVELNERDPEEPRRSVGVVRWYDEAKGYGFIVGPHGEDVFVHCKHVEGHGERRLEEGSRVAYRERQGPRGRFATHVRTCT